MKNLNIDDAEIEMLFFGKWRFTTDWEIIYVDFRKDMTYQQTKIQTFILSKPMELLTGNKFTGIWYVNDGRLFFNLKTVPKSGLNVRVPWLPNLNFANTVVNLSSLFTTEKYKVLKINNSKFVMMDKDKSIVGTKIN